MREINISVIGLGKLGACIAACFAAKGFSVVGVDTNPYVVEKINNRVAPVCEPKLDDMIAHAKDRLCATMDYRIAIDSSDVSFIITPTPSNEDGSFSDRYLKSALEPLAIHFATSQKKHHTFVISSTVSPQTIEKSIIPFLEEKSRKCVGVDFDVAYNPEFIALGDVINGILRPDFVLIGELNQRVGDLLENIYKSLCDNSPRIARMSIVSAEIAKISLNAFVTTKISFANTLYKICENIPGSNIDDITTALGHDRRISPHYLRGGFPFGGPCFPRDNHAFICFAESIGEKAELAKATHLFNTSFIASIKERILNEFRNANQKNVSILGLAFKPGTPVIDESPAIHVIHALIEGDPTICIYVFDPLAMEKGRSYFRNVRSHADSVYDHDITDDAINEIHPQLHFSSSAQECVKQSPIILILTPDPVFAALSPELFQDKKVLDYWRILSKI